MTKFEITDIPSTPVKWEEHFKIWGELSDANRDPSRVRLRVTGLYKNGQSLDTLHRIKTTGSTVPGGVGKMRNKSWSQWGIDLRFTTEAEAGKYKIEVTCDWYDAQQQLVQRDTTTEIELLGHL